MKGTDPREDVRVQGESQQFLNELVKAIGEIVKEKKTKLMN